MKKKDKNKIKNVGTFEDLALMVEQDRTEDYQTDATAETVMQCLTDKLSTDLWDYLIGMLQGFNAVTQTEIADCLMDFVNDQVVHLTGFPSVDTVLSACYGLIANEKGFKYTNYQYVIH